MPNSHLELTDVQRAFLAGMTDQRVANMWDMADLLGEMSADGRQFLRSLGDPDKKELGKFLRDANPDTLKFLCEARPEEISKLKEGIQYVVALQLLGRFGRWGVITAFGTMMGFFVLWDKFVSFWKLK